MESEDQITRLLDSLEEDGLIERRLNRADRRKMDILLTARGSSFLEELHSALERMVLERLELLNMAGS